MSAALAAGFTYSRPRSTQNAKAGAVTIERVDLMAISKM